MTDEPKKVLEEAEWPDDAVADGRVYSLEVSRVMRLDEETFCATQEFVWVPAEPDVNEPPEFERMTGTYADVSRRAVHINAVQRRSGFTAWLFYPAPVEPQGVGG